MRVRSNGEVLAAATTPCEVAACVSTGATTFQCIVQNAVDGTACDDGEPCKLGDRCVGGACKPGHVDKVRLALQSTPTGSVVWRAVQADGDAVVVAGQRVTNRGTGMQRTTMVVARLDAMGRVARWHAIGEVGGTPGELGAWDVVVGGDGTTAVVGETRTKGQGISYARLLVMSADLSTTKLTATAWSDGGARAITAIGGGYALAGWRGGTKGGAHLTLISESGKALGAYTFEGKPGTVFNDVLRRADGKLVVAGTAHKSKTRTDRLLALFNPLDGVGTATAFGFEGSLGTIRTIRQVGGYLLAAGQEAESGKAPQPWVGRMELDGTAQWDGTFGAEGRAVGALPMSDGGFIALARKGKAQTAAIWLRRYGPYGHVVWQQTLKPAFRTDPYALAAAPDGNLLVAGLGGGTGDYRGLLLRTDPWGHASCKTAGACASKTAKACDDANPCTDDFCEPGSGCLSVPNLAPCDDGNACTEFDACKATKCTAGDAVKCDDPEACEVVSCEPSKGCVSADDKPGTACDDGDKCTTDDKCAAGGKCSGNKANCADNLACTADSCDADKGCLHTPVDKACDNKNDCTTDTCDAKKGCVHTHNTAPCDDGVACTVRARCKGGACQKGETGKLWDIGISEAGNPTYYWAWFDAVSPVDAGSVAFIAAGGMHNYGGTGKGRRPFAAGLGPTGKQVWNRPYHSGWSAAGVEAFRGVVPVKDGAILMGFGSKKLGDSHDAFAIRVAAKDGAQQWAFRYKDGGTDRIFAATQRHGGGAIGVGETRNAANKSADGWLLMISEQGFQLSSRKIGNAKHERLLAVTRYGKGYAMAGSRSMPTEGSWIVVTDADGKVLLERSLVFSSADWATAITPMQGGGLAVAGTVSRGSLKADPFVLALNADGSARWRHAWTDGKARDGTRTIAGLRATSDGNVLVIGNQEQTWRARLAAEDGHVIERHGLGGGTVFGGAAVDDDGMVLVGSNTLWRFRTSVMTYNGGGIRSASARRIDAWGHNMCKNNGACPDMALKDCDDGNACTFARCGAGKCQAAAKKGAVCDGTAFCTARSACDGGGKCAPVASKLFDLTEDKSPYIGSKVSSEARFAVAATADGGYVTAGTDRRPGGFNVHHTGGLIGRYDKGGAAIWGHGRLSPKGCSGNHTLAYNDVVPTRAGGYVVVGYRGNYCGGSQYGHFVYGLFATYDAFGRMERELFDRLSNKKATSWGPRGFYSVVETSDGHFIAAGYNRHASKVDGMWLYGVHATDDTTKVEFSEMPIAGGGIGTDITIAADGAAVVSSNKGSLGYFNAKTGKLLQWAQPLQSSGKQLYGIAAYRDGVVAVGFADNGAYSEGRAGYIARYGKDRKVVWEKTYDGAGKDAFSELALLPGGRLVVAGTATAAGKGSQGRALFIDGGGAVFRETLVGGASNEYVGGVAVLKDERVLLVGWRGDASKSDGWHTTLTPYGHDKCVTAGFCADTPLSKCIDSNPCTLDACDPGKGCVHTNVKDGTSCGDGNTGKTCKAGVCS